MLIDFSVFQVEGILEMQDNPSDLIERIKERRTSEERERIKSERQNLVDLILGKSRSVGFLSGLRAPKGYSFSTLLLSSVNLAALSMESTRNGTRMCQNLNEGTQAEVFGRFLQDFPEVRAWVMSELRVEKIEELCRDSLSQIEILYLLICSQDLTEGGKTVILGKLGEILLSVKKAIETWSFVQGSYSEIPRIQIMGGVVEFLRKILDVIDFWDLDFEGRLNEFIGLFEQKNVLAEFSIVKKTSRFSTDFLRHSGIKAFSQLCANFLIILAQASTLNLQSQGSKSLALHILKQHLQFLRFARLSATSEKYDKSLEFTLKRMISVQEELFLCFFEVLFRNFEGLRGIFAKGMEKRTLGLIFIRVVGFDVSEVEGLLMREAKFLEVFLLILSEFSLRKSPQIFPQSSSLLGAFLGDLSTSLQLHSPRFPYSVAPLIRRLNDLLTPE